MVPGPVYLTGTGFVLFFLSSFSLSTALFSRSSHLFSSSLQVRSYFLATPLGVPFFLGKTTQLGIPRHNRDMAGYPLNVYISRAQLIGQRHNLPGSGAVAGGYTQLRLSLYVPSCSWIVGRIVP